MNPANQRGSTTKLFNPQDSSVYQWSETIGIVPRGTRLLDQSELIQPYLRDAGHFPDSRFQACITPTHYASSRSADVHIHRNSEEISPASSYDGHLLQASSKSANVPKVDRFLC